MTISVGLIHFSIFLGLATTVGISIFRWEFTELGLYSRMYSWQLVTASYLIRLQLPSLGYRSGS